MTEREKFEKHMKMLGFIDMHYSRSGAGSSAEGYSNQYVHYAWAAWQARAAQDESVDALKAENERLRKTILEARDQIASRPIDCLGDGYTQEGHIYPIRDEMVYRFTAALAEPSNRRGAK